MGESEKRDSTLSNAPVAGEAGAPEIPVVDEGWYQIDGELARGGLGRILRANDRRMARVVALKTPLAGDGASQRRLLREAVLTGRLQHPAIVPVYEAGRFANGEPFYAMKWVTGRSLREVIAQARTLADRVALLPHVIAVADAVAYAHSLRIIHRDIKPSNIVVGAYGETVLLDWGLAKDLLAAAGDDSIEGRPGETAEGAVLGTPGYMPPEQALSPAVDERADVYALGAVLYETLSGTPPYSGAAVEVLAKLAAHPPPPLGAEVPPDLAAIVKKAMARDPQARYATAGELAADLRRFATGQLVSSHQYSPAALLKRWLRRYRVVLSAATLALVAVALVTAVSFRRTAGARHLAEERRDQLVLAQARVALEKDPTATVAWIKSYPVRAADWKTAGALFEDAKRLGVARHVYEGVNMVALAGPLVAMAGPSLRLCQLDSGRCRQVASPDGTLVDVALSPDGKLAATLGEQGALRLVSTENGESRALEGRSQSTHALALSFSPDGERLAVESGTRLWVYDLAGKVRELSHPDQGPLQQIRFSADGRLLAATSFDSPGVRVWDLASGTSRLYGEQAPSGAEIIFDGDFVLAANGIDHTIDEWRLPSGEHRSLRGLSAFALALALDGDRLISGDENGQVLVWSRKSGESRPVAHHAASLTGVALWKDWVASSSEDGAVRLTHLGSGDQKLLLGHQGDLLMVRFSHDGRHLVSVGLDKSARVWDLGEPRRRVLRVPKAAYVAPAFSPDGKQLAWACDDGQVRLCDRLGENCRLLDGEVHHFSSLEFSGDGKYLLAAGQELRIWDSTGGISRLLWTQKDSLPKVVFSPDSRLIAAAGGYGNQTLVFETGSGKRRLSIPEKQWASTVAFSPDSKRLASGGDDGDVTVTDLDGHRRLILSGSAAPNHSLCFSPDGRSLAAANNGGEVWLWDLASGNGHAFPIRHDAPAVVLAFSPDGARLASGGYDHMVRLWDLRSGGSRLLRGHRAPVNAVRFSPDGRTLVSAGADGAIRLWQVGGDEYRVLRAHEKSVAGIAFSPDGTLLASAGEDATVQLWFVEPFAPTLSAEQILLRAAAVSSAQLDDHDQPATQ